MQVHVIIYVHTKTKTRYCRLGQAPRHKGPVATLECTAVLRGPLQRFVDRADKGQRQC